MEEMKDFHDTHSNLSQWLGAKDRMMAALGPISTDSRMVQTQVQQVSNKEVKLIESYSIVTYMLIY